MKCTNGTPVRAATFLVAILWAGGCGDEPTEPAQTNRAPALVGSVAAQSLFIGDTAVIVASGYFSDPDGDALSYGAESSDAGVVTAAVAGDTVRVVAVGKGTATVTVTASDPDGLSASQDFTATVPNRAPGAIGSIPALETRVGETAPVVVAAYFSDPDGDALSYEAESSDAGVVTAAVSGDTVRVVAVAAGRATIMVTASDGEGLSAAQSFPVSVAPDRQRAILEAVYEALGGSGWTQNDNWLTDSSLDSWHGVEVDDRGRVIRLSLGANNLQGTIPAELGGLSGLQYLRFADNGLTGTIPPELGDLGGLKFLELHGNALGGTIPPELGRLSNLDILNLGDNELEGSIPPELGGLSELRALNLLGNNLTGSLPPELGNLPLLNRIYLQFNELDGTLPPELGRLSSLRILELNRNRFEGTIPAELGDLDNLFHLTLDQNQFQGPLPFTFLQVRGLSYFRFSRNLGLCVPRTSGFLAWLEGIGDSNGPLCGDEDRTVLETFYEVAGGPDWNDSGGWGVAENLDDWYGVKTDSLGYVMELDLGGNGLRGRIPSEIGDLEGLKTLEIGSNDLRGPLPLAMIRLPLERFGYGETKLCAQDDDAFRQWLNGIPSLEETGVECADPREVLAALYNATGGANWRQNQNWMSDAPLDEWFGVDTDEDGQVTRIELFQNGLHGPIPPELGDLPRLEQLRLWSNSLSGSIPPELGNLSSLLVLMLDGNRLSGSLPPELGDLHNALGIFLFNNQLTGSIPPELGRLSSLYELRLNDNRLTGPIPPELGDLPVFQDLYLDNNNLSGPIPPELADLSDLRRLVLSGNDFSGPLPPELGRLRRLLALLVAHNPRLAGPLPLSFTGLADLRTLNATGTELCAPSDAAFLRWFEGVRDRRVKICEREPAAAYLIQSTQSRDYPVPLVADKQALLRVFVTASRNTDETIPPVRARFHVNGSEAHTVTIPGKSTVIPTEVDEGSLAKSSNVAIPAHIVRPGLEMVIEIDPEGSLDEDLLAVKQIPEAGRLGVEVHFMPDLDLTLIPFLWTEDPDSSVLATTVKMTEEKEGHDLLHDTYDLLPIRGMAASLHDPVESSSNDALDLHRQVFAMRQMERGSGHWMGLMAGSVGGPQGVASRPGHTSFSILDSWVIAHELAHNLNALHAPCGVSTYVDPSFPQPNGSIGTWGYDHRLEELLPPSTSDFMSYCDPRWVGDYHFSNLVRYRASRARAFGQSNSVAAGPGILLWGGVDAHGIPSLEPAFVVDAPPTMPRRPGPYTLTGKDAAGTELFDVSFAMEEIPDGEGKSAVFALILPVEEEWTGPVASIILSGPDGSVTVDGGTDTPMAIVRDVESGQVRAFWRGLQAPPVLPRGFEVHWSRGVPGREEWER